MKLYTWVSMKEDVGKGRRSLFLRRSQVKHQDGMRLTVRFRLDKSRDREAYNNLLKLSEKQNSSLNETILDLLAEPNKGHSCDDLVTEQFEQLALLIADKIKKEIPAMISVPTNNETEHGLSNDGEEDITTIIDEDTASFLDSFGIG